MPVPALEFDDVTIGYGSAPVVSGLSLSVERGETLALAGPSGSGKTSLVRAILGLIAPSHGVIRISGQSVSERGRILVAPESRNLAVVFQDLALWPHMSVRDHLAFVLESRKIDGAERDALIADMLDEVALGNRSQRRPGELSGGERQRVALARALVVKPLAIILDEPMTSLDVVLKRELVALLQRVLAKHGTTAIYVTHDPVEARTLGDRIAIVSDSRLLQIGTWSELCASPAGDFVAAFTR